MVVIIGSVNGVPITADAISPVPVPRNRSTRQVLQAAPGRDGEPLMSHPTRHAEYEADPGLTRLNRQRTATFPSPPQGAPASYLSLVPPTGSVFAPNSRRITQDRVLTPDFSTPPGNEPRPVHVTAVPIAPQASVQAATPAEILGQIVLWAAVGFGIYAAIFLGSESLGAIAGGK